MTSVTDVRRAGSELDVHDFVRELKRQARWYLPKGAPKAVVRAAVTRRLREGNVPMPPGLELPPHLVLVAVSRHFGVEYYWRCPRCWQPRRFLYRWSADAGWCCRRCWRLRYASQAWSRLPPLQQFFLGRWELEVLDMQQRSYQGRVGRPPTRTLQRLSAKEADWHERWGDAMERVSLQLGLGGREGE
jgi:hypothetical protein